jgi:phosphate transport system substrate-binding protein
MWNARLLLSFSLTAVAMLAVLPSALCAQVRPDLDPNIPSYLQLDQISAKVTISTSETMKPLVRALVDDLVRRHPKLKVKFTGEGTETGLAALLEHRAEIAAMSRRMTADEIAEFIKEYGYEPTEVPVAGDALAVFVHKDNPISGLALEELDAMFCRERHRGVAYNIDSWGLVGLLDEWFEAPVQIYGRNGKSNGGLFFREEICKGGTFRPQLVEGQGPASTILEVENDPYGIGFSSVGFKTSMVKPVPVALIKGGRYVEPSLQAAMDGTYPLRRHLYFYFAKPPKSPPTPTFVELVRYALSRQGQQRAVNLGYLPLSSMEIARVTSKWTGVMQAACLETPNSPVIE